MLVSYFSGRCREVKVIPIRTVKGGVELQRHSFLTLALNVSKRPASNPRRVTIEYGVDWASERSGRFGEEITSLLPAGIGTPNLPVRSLVTTLTTILRLRMKEVVDFPEYGGFLSLQRSSKFVAVL